MLPKFLEHAVAVRLGLHVDEVADDDSAHVAKPELARDFGGCFHVGAEDGLLGILLTSVATRVDVD